MPDISKLQQIAVNVNSILDEYIAIENEVYKPSWRRIIPLPFIFEAINFDSLLEKSNKIESQLTSEKEELNNLSQVMRYESDESRFASHFLKYCDVLLNAVSQLRNMVEKLQQKSQDSSVYKHKEYKRDTQIYRKVRDEYFALGKEANDLYANAFSS